MNPVSTFRAQHYLDINSARMEHLQSLALPLAGKKILELGAGIGDITAFLVDHMGCGTVTRIESRQENCDVMRIEHPEHPVICADLMSPKDIDEPFDVGIAYGILYHLSDPREAIAFMARHCPLAVVETCVSMGPGFFLNPVSEGAHDPSQASRGVGSRPTRAWMQSALKKYFRHVMCPRTQPNHYQFPLDWSEPSKAPLTRAIFVCSEEPMSNPMLLPGLPEKHDPFTKS